MNCYICGKTQNLTKSSSGTTLCRSCNGSLIEETIATQVAEKVEQAFTATTEPTSVITNKLLLMQNSYNFVNLHLPLEQMAKEGLEPLIFGGVIRSIAFGSTPRDIDIICLGSKTSFKQYVNKNCGTLKVDVGRSNINSFSFPDPAIKSEIWHVSNQKCIKTTAPKATDVINNVFYNCEAAVLSCKPFNGKIMYDLITSDGFNNLLRTKELDIENGAMAAEFGAIDIWKRVAKAVYLCKQGFTLSKRLKDQLKYWIVYTLRPNGLDELQMVKYGECHTNVEDLVKYLS